MIVTTRDSSSQNNAMTEVALALAMGFFSIMVLTLVSMSVDTSKSTPDSLKQKDVPNTLAVPLAQNASSKNRPGMMKPAPEDMIVIFDGQRFLDTTLKPVNPAGINTSARIILAVDPNVRLDRALAARAQLASRNVIVSSLDKRWQAALARDTATGKEGGK